MTFNQFPVSNRQAEGLQGLFGLSLKDLELRKRARTIEDDSAALSQTIPQLEAQATLNCDPPDPLLGRQSIVIPDESLDYTASLNAGSTPSSDRPRKKARTHGKGNTLSQPKANQNQQEMTSKGNESLYLGNSKHFGNTLSVHAETTARIHGHNEALQLGSRSQVAEVRHQQKSNQFISSSKDQTRNEFDKMLRAGQIQALQSPQTPEMSAYDPTRPPQTQLTGQMYQGGAPTFDPILTRGSAKVPLYQPNKKVTRDKSPLGFLQPVSRTQNAYSQHVQVPNQGMPPTTTWKTQAIPALVAAQSFPSRGQQQVQAQEQEWYRGIAQSPVAALQQAATQFGILNTGYQAQSAQFPSSQMLQLYQQMNHYFHGQQGTRNWAPMQPPHPMLQYQQFEPMQQFTGQQPPFCSYAPSGHFTPHQPFLHSDRQFSQVPSHSQVCQFQHGQMGQFGEQRSKMSSSSHIGQNVSHQPLLHLTGQNSQMQPHSPIGNFQQYQTGQLVGQQYGMAPYSRMIQPTLRQPIHQPCAQLSQRKPPPQMSQSQLFRMGQIERQQCQMRQNSQAIQFQQHQVDQASGQQFKMKSGPHVMQAQPKQFRPMGGSQLELQHESQVPIFQATHTESCNKNSTHAVVPQPDQEQFLNLLQDDGCYAGLLDNNGDLSMAPLINDAIGNDETILLLDSLVEYNMDCHQSSASLDDSDNRVEDQLSDILGAGHCTIRGATDATDDCQISTSTGDVTSQLELEDEFLAALEAGYSATVDCTDDGQISISPDHGVSLFEDELLAALDTEHTIAGVDIDHKGSLLEPLATHEAISALVRDGNDEDPVSTLQDNNLQLSNKCEVENSEPMSPFTQQIMRTADQNNYFCNSSTPETYSDSIFGDCSDLDTWFNQPSTPAQTNTNNFFKFEGQHEHLLSAADDCIQPFKNSNKEDNDKLQIFDSETPL